MSIRDRFYINSKEESISIAPVSESNFILQCIIPQSWTSPNYKFLLTKISDLNRDNLRLRK